MTSRDQKNAILSESPFKQSISAYKEEDKCGLMRTGSVCSAFISKLCTRASVMDRRVVGNGPGMQN